jgi:hypothetical protein
MTYVRLIHQDEGRGGESISRKLAVTAIAAPTAASVARRAGLFDRLLTRIDQ